MHRYKQTCLSFLPQKNKGRPVKWIDPPTKNKKHWIKDYWAMPPHKNKA